MTELSSLSREEKDVIKDALFDKAMNLDKVLKKSSSYKQRLREIQDMCFKLIDKFS